MSLIHEVLYRHDDLSRVDFASYLENLGRMLLGSAAAHHRNVSLKVNAEKLALVVDTAIPCGLIANELISNSLKHAFPGTGKGRCASIFVRRGRTIHPGGLRRRRGDPGGCGPGARSSLGLKLVSILTEMLGGRLTVQRGPGTTISVAFANTTKLTLSFSRLARWRRQRRRCEPHAGSSSLWWIYFCGGSRRKSAFVPLGSPIEGFGVGGIEGQAYDGQGFSFPPGRQETVRELNVKPSSVKKEDRRPLNPDSLAGPSP